MRWLRAVSPRVGGRCHRREKFKAGYADRTIFLLWASVLATGVVAAIASKLFISGSESMAAVRAQAVAGGDSGNVLAVVGGFLFALHLALAEAVP